MNKEQRLVVVEYMASLSDEDLRWLAMRLVDRFPGEFPEALDFMSKDEKMNPILYDGADSGWQFYDLSDRVKELAVKECKKRGIGA